MMSMAGEVIQFRESKEIVDKVRRRNLNPNRVAREAFEATVRELEAQDQMKRLAKFKVKLPKPAAEIIREDRDAH